MPKVSDLGTNIPAVTERSAVLEKFAGVDLSSSPVNVNMRRATAAPNMLADEDGYPKKRTGYETVAELEGKIHGAYRLEVAGIVTRMLHAGTKLYRYTDDPAAAEAVYEDMNDGRSVGLQLCDKLWILDGKTYLVFDGETCQPVSEIATVPTITIGKAPDGASGATSYQPINLLTGMRSESYLGTQDTKEYYLSYQDLTETEVTAKKLNQSGEWEDLKEDTDFTVSRELGKVTFQTAPGVSPVTGEDNVVITYEVENHRERIDKCKFGILWGVNGAMDRIFMSGNPEFINQDWWTDFRDPAYIGDTFYSQLGSESSPIVGYNVLGNYLVTLKRGEENGRNAIVRSGETDEDGFGLFKIQNIIQGEGCVEGATCQSISGEPVFLTAQGVTALTTGDVTGEKYSQNRSYYINSALTKASLQEATSTVWGRYYVLAVGDRLYLLDSNQKSYESRQPYSTHQFECYYFTGIGATCLWTEGEVLWYGTAGGKIRRFKKGEVSEDYNDDGNPIEAYWATPNMNLGIWSNLKSVSACWVVLQPYSRSGADCYYQTDKEPEYLARSTDVDIFNFNDVDFDRFTFETMETPTVLNLRKKVRKIKTLQVIVRNGRANEPFGLYAIHINYRVAGKVKR